MKKILVLVAVLVIACVSVAQMTHIASKFGRANTNWTKLGAPSGRIMNPYISNDTTAGADTLWVVVGRDTAMSHRIPVLKTKSIVLTGVAADTIMVRASANTIPYTIFGGY